VGPRHCLEGGESHVSWETNCSQSTEITDALQNKDAMQDNRSLDPMREGVMLSLTLCHRHFFYPRSVTTAASSVARRVVSQSRQSSKRISRQWWRLILPP
jgi:hypothetical protein